MKKDLIGKAESSDIKDRICDYLEGTMEAAVRNAFEQELSQNPSWQQEMKKQMDFLTFLNQSRIVFREGISQGLRGINEAYINKGEFDRVICETYKQLDNIYDLELMKQP
ncbi:MAG: hypothetical protein NHB14_25040 [Desulfosporosinus sp.]|nr:hypothetical protein [Desulfosporosinus sp.]